MFAGIPAPVDFTDLEPRTLRLAVELAGTTPGARVALLSVIDDSFPNPDILSFQLPWADDHRHLRDEAGCRMEKPKAEVEVCVVRGHPARAIVSFADAARPDLIVMATHGTRGLQHALLGSVTDKVIRQVSCPVLVVRLHQGGDASAPAPPPR